MDSSNHSILDYAKNILIQEANALLQLSKYLDETFNYVGRHLGTFRENLFFVVLEKVDILQEKLLRRVHLQELLHFLCILRKHCMGI